MLKILKLPYLVFVICIDNLIVYFGYFAILPILAILLTQQQYSIDQVALASLVFIVALRSGRFFLGPFLDGVHPRPIMISGLLLAGISFMLIGFVNSYWMLLCCLCLIGLGQSANGLAGKSYISAMGAKDGNSLQYFSGLNVFVNIAAVFGPLFGTYMLTSGYQTYVFQIIGSFYLFTALVVLLLLRKFKMTESTPSSSGFSFFKRYKSVLSNRKYVRFLFFNIVGWFCYAQLFMALPYYISMRYGTSDKMGLLYSLNAILVITLQMFVSSLIKKYLPAGRENSLLLFSYLLFALSFVSVTVHSSFYILFGTVFLFTLAEMIFTPSVDTIVSNLANPEQRITYFSFLGLSTAVGEGLGSFVGIRLLHYWQSVGHFEYFWLTIAIIAGVACLVLRMLMPHNKSDTVNENTPGLHS